MNAPKGRTPEKVAERLAKAAIERRQEFLPGSVFDRKYSAIVRGGDTPGRLKRLDEMMDEMLVAVENEEVTNEAECQAEYDAMSGEERVLAKLYMGEVNGWWRKKINE